LKVISATLISERGTDGKEWVCHTRRGKMFHLVYQAGVLQASNVVEREYDLELNSKPIATSLTVEKIFSFSNRRNRNKIGFKDIKDLMGWKMDADQWTD
jgi:hypothetical protein